MTCPKPGGPQTLPDGNREQSQDNGVLISQTGLLHQVSESSLTLTGSHFSSQDRLEQLYPVTRDTTRFVHPEIWHHSNPAGTGLSHPVTQIQGTFTHPGVQSPQPGEQNQPGMLRPVLVSQNHPSLMHSGGQTQPGQLRPGSVSQNQPGMVYPGSQNQPGIHPGSVSQNQPGMMHLGGQNQPGTRPGSVPVGRMPCVAPQGRDGCVQAGCCYDDMDRATPCYYGNTATVQCLLEGYFVLVVPRGMVAPQYNLDSVRLASSQAGCEPLHVSEAFVMFRFPVTHCGTTVQVVEDKLIYENQLITTIDVQGSPRGSVTRDSVYIVPLFSPSLPSLQVAMPPTAAPLAMPGPLGLQLRIATDESYSSYHPVGDFPLVRVLRDPIYVEVRLLQKTDPNLVLVLHHCWASPGSHATSQPQWPILVDGCPFQGDNYRTRLIPVGPASLEMPFPSHYQRFVIYTFAFVEPPGMAVLEGEVRGIPLNPSVLGIPQC
uniref:Zona pellucida glycoprotein 1 n=1 Tax=Malurus cyaneus samueli TaxID=2593467 RepID=A0A8C5UHX8_9PASS